ncbi:MAG: ATP-binding cassette domain-containing protein, partial [Rhizobiales bacterium]|nr:ATP-binding cassette domain-containing protein [Hyphomicrobiales bacterium]
RETIWFETRSRHWSHIVESIAYANTVRVNAAHHFAEHRFSDRLNQNLSAHLSVITLTACLDALGRLASGLIIAAIVLIGGLRVIEGDMSVGDFVLVLSVGGSLSAPVLALVKLFDDVQAATVSIDRLWTLAQAPHEAISCSPLPARKGGARLDIDGLEFSYPDQETPVLSGVSCTFDPGERVALVGPSGIGKSTLASLIFAARTPNRGNIRLDSIPLDQIPLDELRQRIVVVPHEIDVFTGTVTDNICLDPAWTDAGAVKAAVVVAGIESDIRALPQGYETMLGQGGVDLSAGQKQRLGIARAVLRRPDILVLDESTSALDAETERRVLDALLDALPQTTIVAITHRPSVMARMDRSIEIGRR